MSRFRKSGSFVRFFVEGIVPQKDSDGFFVAVAKHRFKSIENAASEETSIGWACPSDPSGQNFLKEQILQDDYVRLRIRLDKKKLPGSWLGIYMDAEIKALGAKRIKPEERKAIKADIAEKLLPRILPSVRFIDFIYDEKKKIAYLFSSARSVREECQLLFFKTFKAKLVEARPLEVARRLRLSADQLRYLDKISPLPFVKPAPLAKPKQYERVSSREKPEEQVEGMAS